MIDVKPLQPLKAKPPILVTELGIVIDVRLLQLSKAELPILVTEFGIVIDVRLLQLMFVALIDNQRVASDTAEKC